jgi:hypothetical protein
LFDTWLRTRQAAEDEVKREEAELLRDAESLVDNMQAYADGYRELSGLLLTFNARWSEKQRDKAIDTHGKWMDRRNIARAIERGTNTLDDRCSGLASSRQGEREYRALLDLQVAAQRFLSECVTPLMGAKASVLQRQEFQTAIRNPSTSPDEERVRHWAEVTFAFIEGVSPILAAAEAALDQLKSALSRRRPFLEARRSEQTVDDRT